MTNLEWVQSMDLETFWEWLTVRCDECIYPVYVTDKNENFVISNKGELPKFYPPLDLIGTGNISTRLAIKDWLKQEHKEKQNYGQ